MVPRIIRDHDLSAHRFREVTRGIRHYFRVPRLRGLFAIYFAAAALGPLGDMRPVLGSAGDVAALWAHLNDTIDCIATDHAPHTLEEKRSTNPPPGVPGLETSLPLMLAAVQEGKMTVERLTALMYENPRRIFGLPEQPETRVEVDMTPWIIPAEGWQTKCGWTAFAGLAAGGRVRRVVLRGRVVYQDGQVLAQPGSGRVINGENSLVTGENYP